MIAFVIEEQTDTVVTAAAAAVVLPSIMTIKRRLSRHCYL